MARGYITQLARENRQEQTPAEAILWAAFGRKAFDGVKFKRQKLIGHYIADFCAPSLRLIIELDGSVHDTPDAKAYDAVREEFLRAAGYTILRFPNQAILENLEKALEQISIHIPKLQ